MVSKTLLMEAVGHVCKVVLCVNIALSFKYVRILNNNVTLMDLFVAKVPSVKLMEGSK